MIDEARIYTIKQAMKKPIKVTNDASAIVESVIVALRADDGTVGFGESSPLRQFGGETPETVLAVVRRHLAPCVIGADPFDIEKLTFLMDQKIDGNPCAKSGVEMALYDLMGKEAKKPLCKLLGGRYRDSVREGGGSGIVPVDETIDYVRKLYIERGVKKIKLKVGLSPARDIECVRRLREDFGDEITIRVDVNQGWRNPSAAISVIRKMERYDLDFVEQPLPAWNLDGIAEIRKATSVPVMLDESVYTPKDALLAIEKHACDVIDIKLAKSGGIRNALAINAIAEASGIPCYLGSMGETGIGMAAGMQISAAQKNVEDGDFRLARVHSSDEETTDPYEEVTATDGLRIKVPDGYGLGLRIDEKVIKKYGSSTLALNRSDL